MFVELSGGRFINVDQIVKVTPREGEESAITVYLTTIADGLGLNHYHGDDAQKIISAMRAQLAKVQKPKGQPGGVRGL